MTKLQDLWLALRISKHAKPFILKLAVDIAWAKSSPPLVKNSDWTKIGTIPSHPESTLTILTNGYSAVLKLIVEVDGQDDELSVCNPADTMVKAGAQEGSKFVLKVETDWDDFCIHCLPSGGVSDVIDVVLWWGLVFGIRQIENPTLHYN